MARCEHKISGICKECMKKDFNLSEKIRLNSYIQRIKIIEVKDVKEFIKKLKEELCFGFDLIGQKYIKENIDKLTGDEFK